MATVVFPEEIDYLIDSLRRFQVYDVGTSRWFDQNETIMKLTQQAYIEACSDQEEVVKDRIKVEGKLPLLVHEIHCILVWKNKLLPILLKEDKLEASFVLYSVLYYELTIVTLLETILFHRGTCEALNESALDLTDYCAQVVGLLIGLSYDNKQTVSEQSNGTLNESAREEIERLKRDVDFKIGLKCLTILSYLTNNIMVLPLSTKNRLTRVHDIPCLIAEILHVKPWIRRRNGIEKFIDDGWISTCGNDILKVTKHEAQSWFCLFSVLSNNDIMEDYNINEFRQEQIGKCLGLLNECILDQLPALVQLKQILSTLKMQRTKGRGHGGLLLEELPEIKNDILNEAGKYGWSKIIETHKRTFIELPQEEISDIAKRLYSAYNTGLMEIFAYQDKKSSYKFCEVCKKSAEKKCSKCECIFYCSRECQVSDWTRHKKQCHHLKIV
ncbi:zinc finger MYND domain-containing protein 10 homolog isoform X2 [Toxorhynchites rutilus septentrionalis]|uniref:zinc finger MYND domain-containing protein 10 homolog isoform X2 n=1 Tax=Toxorhynchites rutilus septentrionalis TaxID=329112 RepID=UPI00247ACCF5|nr:zinc finger MYND domain-containing protein 10 homolog isoform X2 [Toxorhynchites rutilus septentrionalis]